MVVIGAIITIGFLVVMVNLSIIVFVKGNAYKQAAYAQQTKSQIISSNRGTIYDANGEILAVSVTVDTVSINPGKVKYENGTEVDPEVLATKFSEVFGLDYEETLNKVNSESSVSVIARKVENDKVNILKEWMEEEHISSGINIDEDYKRYYPNGSLASTLIGFCGTDNVGMTGLEQRWNDVLVGSSGVRVVTSDVNGTAISDENEEYIPAENGSNIYLTIDSTIQSIAEKYLKEAVIANNADFGGVILMNPQNGEIKAMANYPDYDLNDPQNPNPTGLASTWDTLSAEEKSNAKFELWANKNVSSLYEPGSTFKTIITAIALEEGIVETDTPGDFYCDGGQTFEEIPEDEPGHYIACWSPVPHYDQSLREAIEHSCNPAFMQLGKRIGIRTMYKYFDAFGLFDRVGNNIASAPNPIFTKLEKVGIIEQATTSFGQRFSITPLQLITAVSAIANGGKLVEPKIVGKIENTDTGSFTNVETEIVRQVVSEQTSDTVKDLMLSVVTEGTGGRAKVTGYEVGGKSGTSEPTAGKEDEGYVASFIAISPIENTQIVCLVVIYNPKNEANGHQGGSVCGPVAGQILTEVLPYMNVNGLNAGNISDSSGITYSNSKTIINRRGMSVANAREKLQNSGFNVVVGNVSDEASTIVVDQMPKPGAYLEAGSTVYLYTSEDETKQMTTVPDLKSKTMDDAISDLRNMNLNYMVDGTSGTVTSQSIIAGTEVEAGSVITIYVKENATGGQ